MRDEAPMGDVLDIAASDASLLQRAQALVERLDRWLPVDAIWLTLADPGAQTYATVGSSGLEQPVLDYLGRPEVAREIRLAQVDRARLPISVTELPVPVEELPTWADCLIPAGFREGLGVPLCEPGGTYVGMLSLLFAGGDPPSPQVRADLARLAPVMARGVSPLRSLVATARLVEGATSGLVLLRDGRTFPLPGFADPPLRADTALTGLARRTLESGLVYRSFAWPTGARDEGDEGGEAADRGHHVCVTVLAVHDAPAFVCGLLLVRPDADCGGLTPRELQVLGHLVEGHSNQQVAHRLAITTRTVAAHVEHIMRKLDAPSRTLAAVRAEREGWHVPPV